MVGTAPSSSNCVGYWKKEDLTDSSGNGHTLVNNGATSTTGILDNGYNLNGNDWMNYNNNNLWDVIKNDTQGSFNIWIKTSTDSNTYFFMPTKYSTNAHSGFALMTSWGGTGLLPAFEFNTTFTAGTTRLYATTRVDDGNWHMVTWWSNGSTNKVYIDGIDEGSLNILTGSNTGKWWSSITAYTPTEINLGGLIRTAGNALFYNGDVDEASLWNVALTQDEITYLYNGGTPTSAQQYPFSGTPSTDTFSKIDGVAYTSYSKIAGGVDKTSLTSYQGVNLSS
jgi:hypothetical protein